MLQVVIDENIVVPPLTRLQSEVFIDEDSFGEDDFDDDHKSDQDKTCDLNVVGKKGHGYICKVSVESDEEEEGVIEDVWGKPTDESIEDDDDESESLSSEILNPGEAVSDESEGGGYDDETNQFYNEVLESLQRGIEEKVNSENTILEINASKHAYNITIKEVNTLLLKALLKLPLESGQVSTPQQYLSSIKPSLQFFHPLVSKYIRSAESQLDCLSSIEDFMKSNEDISPALIKVIHFWYDKELLKESVIIKWFKDLSPESDKVRKQATTFITWLQTADEESSEEEESSED
ncbi:Translation initiation factor eIF-2B subunit epsilon [Araneus ventricosus]|uniref:Translation initiation factor eIF2B subunit epsilon n=1 Tax=Araneus ventricosus TaxID=182803 RepID=A0A4Y2J2J2_ARAVE|nr:Translation initiation factor eIF-2B subunit epsilon [Araneus ventricosus]